MKTSLDKTHDLDAARGMLYGTLIVAPFWSLVCVGATLIALWMLK